MRQTRKKIKRIHESKRNNHPSIFEIGRRGDRRESRRKIRDKSIRRNPISGGADWDFKTLMLATIIYGEDPSRNIILNIDPTSSTTTPPVNTLKDIEKEIEAIEQIKSPINVSDFYIKVFITLQIILQNAANNINQSITETYPKYLKKLGVALETYANESAQLKSPTSVTIDNDILTKSDFVNEGTDDKYKKYFRLIVENIRKNNFKDASAMCNLLIPGILNTVTKSYFQKLKLLFDKIHETFPIQQDKHIIKTLTKHKGELDKNQSIEGAITSNKNNNQYITDLVTEYKKLKSLLNQQSALKQSTTTGVGSDHSGKIDQIKQILYGKTPDKQIQIAIVLPYLLQIYESLYKDENYTGTTKIKKHTSIPNKAIMEFMVRQIQRIERIHPHPQLFETIFYFWKMFDLTTALGFMTAYLNEIPSGESEKDVPGQIVTFVEKQLGNTSSFEQWDRNITRPNDFHVYTKIIGQKNNPFRNADSTILALKEYPFQKYNPLVSRWDMDVNVDDETGEFRFVDNRSRTIPSLDKTKKKT